MYFYYFNFDFIIYKINRQLDCITNFLINIGKNPSDSGYTVIDTDTDFYLAYEELWDL
jgi:hypothetical protein